MNSAAPVGLFLLIAIAGLVIRLIAGQLDRDRIREHIESKGGELKSVSWDPMGPGWFGSRNERIYAVHYKDEHGRTIHANCKTSMMSGVYWTNQEELGAATRNESDADVIECMRCGRAMSPRIARCPSCGWSYKNAKE